MEFLQSVEEHGRVAKVILGNLCFSSKNDIFIIWQVSMFLSIYFVFKVNSNLKLEFEAYGEVKIVFTIRTTE